tara:strand:- start:139 stop:879 length:741 start_codon:yes stop_codon:yes gene_type:complete
MAWARCRHPAAHCHAKKIQIAKAIKDLVAHEFAFHAKPALIQNGTVLNHDCIVQGPAKRQAGILHRCHIPHQAKGAGSCQLALKAAGTMPVMKALAANGRIVKINLSVNFEAIARLKLGPATTMLDRNGSCDDENPAPVAKLTDASAIDGFDDWPAAAIKDWRLTTVDIYNSVIHTQPCEGGHDMFNRLKSNTVIIDDPGAQACLAHIVGAGRNGLAAFRHVDAAEQDACIGGGGVDGDANEPAGV